MDAHSDYSESEPESPAGNTRRQQLFIPGDATPELVESSLEDAISAAPVEELRAVVKISFAYTPTSGKLCRSDFSSQSLDPRAVSAKLSRRVSTAGRTMVLLKILKAHAFTTRVCVESYYGTSELTCMQAKRSPITATIF
jgi:hypothetical protein